MKHKKLLEINAGSMADLAFLLLVFFLVVTVINEDLGIRRDLPRPQEDTSTAVVPDRNVLTIKLNGVGDIMAEGNRIQRGDLYPLVMEFMTNSGVFEESININPEMPERRWVSLSGCKMQMELLRRDSLLNHRKIETLKAKIATLDAFGPYREMPLNALIELSCSNDASFDDYVWMQNELQKVFNDLRNELTMKHFYRSYDELKDNDPEDRDRIICVRQVYPQKISEAVLE